MMKINNLNLNKLKNLKRTGIVIGVPLFASTLFYNAYYYYSKDNLFLKDEVLKYEQYKTVITESYIYHDRNYIDINKQSNEQKTKIKILSPYIESSDGFDYNVTTYDISNSEIQLVKETILMQDLTILKDYLDKESVEPELRDVISITREENKIIAVIEGINCENYIVEMESNEEVFLDSLVVALCFIPITFLGILTNDYTNKIKEEEKKLELKIK